MHSGKNKLKKALSTLISTPQNSEEEKECLTRIHEYYASSGRVHLAELAKNKKLNSTGQ